MLHLPGNTGSAYVFVSGHLPETGSALKELEKLDALPVSQAVEGMPIEPDNIYLLPAGKQLQPLENRFQTVDENETPYLDMPVNHFFSALAENYNEAAMGVLLSGADSDGVMGLKAIKMAGGLTFAQDESAKFQSMSRHAVAEGVVDLVLSPRQIAEELGKITKQKEIVYTALNELKEEHISNADEDLLAILQILKKTVGVDFSQYKMNTIKRRIIRRMLLYKLETLHDYAQLIRKNPNEINLLYQDLLINVTSFFRDRDTTEYIRKQLLPKIIKSKSSTDPIRIWVPACSTGQEAYSMAMLLVEALGENLSNIPIQIFGTDLSESAVNKARLGVYSKDEVLEVSPKRLQRFFTKIDGSYRIVKAIRDVCVFATHNIAKDPPFSRLDIITCCNLLIYLDAQLQKKLIATFHYSLNNNGYLVLGKSETVGTSSYLFTQLDKKFKVYAKKKDTAAKAMFEMNFRAADHERSSGLARKNISERPKADELDLEKTVDAVLLKKFTPATVLVNQDLDILQFRGSTGLYLEPSPGKASLNLMKMARAGLGFELRNVVHKARKAGEAVKKSGLELAVDGKVHRINVEAIPLKSDSAEEYYLVVFEEIVSRPEDEQGGSVKDKRVKQLESELNALREDMRSIIEAQEAANEELQSANEEIVSSNEELQSINEELETSKEEIESSNEELITINQELQVRNEQLAEALEYSEAVFTTIRESLLILDIDLRVKTANEAFYKTFLLREDDTEGKLIYDVGNKQWNIPGLHKLLEEILPNNNIHHGFEVVHTFQHVGEKVMLLNARKVLQKSHGQDLILLAIEDITEHRQVQRMISEREAWFRNMADNAPVMISVTDANKISSFFNKAWLEFRGLKLEDAVNKAWTEGIHPDDLPVAVKTFEQHFAARQPMEMQYRVLRHDGEYRLLLNRFKPNNSTEGQFLGYIGSCVEIPG